MDNKSKYSNPSGSHGFHKRQTMIQAALDLGLPEYARNQLSNDQLNAFIIQMRLGNIDKKDTEKVWEVVNTIIRIYTRSDYIRLLQRHVRKFLKTQSPYHLKKLEVLMNEAVNSGHLDRGKAVFMLYKWGLTDIFTPDGTIAPGPIV
jgi:hypothetical protein